VSLHLRSSCKLTFWMKFHRTKNKQQQQQHHAPPLASVQRHVMSSCIDVTTGGSSEAVAGTVMGVDILFLLSLLSARCRDAAWGARETVSGCERHRKGRERRNCCCELVVPVACAHDKKRRTTVHNHLCFGGGLTDSSAKMRTKLRAWIDLLSMDELTCDTI
jgi:hypothetical protein